MAQLIVLISIVVLAFAIQMQYNATLLAVLWYKLLKLMQAILNVTITGSAVCFNIARNVSIEQYWNIVFLYKKKNNIVFLKKYI